MAIAVARHLRSDDVLQVLTDLFTRYGAPDYIRSDNGSEFTAKSVRAWLPRVGYRPPASETFAAHRADQPFARNGLRADRRSPNSVRSLN